MSNSFPLKNDSGGAGGVMTCFDETSGPPAKEMPADDARAAAAKAMKAFFIKIGFSFSTVRAAIALLSSTLDTQRDQQQIAGVTCEGYLFSVGHSYYTLVQYG